MDKPPLAKLKTVVSSLEFAALTPEAMKTKNTIRIITNTLLLKILLILLYP